MQIVQNLVARRNVQAAEIAFPRGFLSICDFSAVCGEERVIARRQGNI